MENSQSVSSVVQSFQQSHPLASPSPLAFNLPQHQGLFQWVSFLHQVAKELEFQFQHQSFKWIFRTDFLQNWLVGSPCSPRDSQDSSPTHSSKASILKQSAFFIVQLSHPYMTTGKTIGLTRQTFVGKVMSLYRSGQINMLRTGDSVMQPNNLILCRPLLLCPQSTPASGSFPVSQFFAWGSQSIGASASASVLPMNIQDWFPLGWTGWISLQSKGLSRLFSNTQFKSINSAALSFLYSPTLTTIHDYWKTVALTRWTFVSKVMSLLFNMLSRLAIAVLPRSKRILILWLQSSSAVILETKKIKSDIVSTVFQM